MGRLLVLALLLVPAMLTGCTTTQKSSAATGDLQDSARYVRAAIPAIEATAADQSGSYAGLTVAKARAWDSTIRNIVILEATRRGYCVQSTTDPVVHFAGPRGPVREGRCGTSGAIIPFRRTPQPPQPSGNEAIAQEQLRYAVPAAAGFATDNDGYAGMTIQKLHRYDKGVRGITIVWTNRNAYCAEATAGSTTYHQVGPAEASKPGPCPSRD
jgi:hypothetical protein